MSAENPEVLVRFVGKLVGIGSYSEGDDSAEVQLDNGSVVELRGIDRDECKLLAPALFERIAITVARMPAPAEISHSHPDIPQ